MIDSGNKRYLSNIPLNTKRTGNVSKQTATTGNLTWTVVCMGKQGYNGQTPCAGKGF